MSAFDAAKERLARATLLVHPIHSAQLILRTDARAQAIAGALHQRVNGLEQPLAFFSCHTSPAESRNSAYDLELLAIYSSILHFCHVLEGREFRIFTDHRPLMSAFFKARDPTSNRQRHQLAFVSEFCTGIAHVPGVDNVVADALSRQHDDELSEETLVHAVSHLLADINLQDLATDQPQSPIIGPPNSLKLQQVSLPGCDSKVWCDTSQGRLRVLVPQAWREKIFREVHGLSHPSG